MVGAAVELEATVVDETPPSEVTIEDVVVAELDDDVVVEVDEDGDGASVDEGPVEVWPSAGASRNVTGATGGEDLLPRRSSDPDEPLLPLPGGRSQPGTGDTDSIRWSTSRSPVCPTMAASAPASVSATTAVDSIRRSDRSPARAAVSTPCMPDSSVNWWGDL